MSRFGTIIKGYQNMDNQLWKTDSVLKKKPVPKKKTIRVPENVTAIGAASLKAQDVLHEKMCYLPIVKFIHHLKDIIFKKLMASLKFCTYFIFIRFLLFYNILSLKIGRFNAPPCIILKKIALDFELQLLNIQLIYKPYMNITWHNGFKESPCVPYKLYLHLD